MQISKINISVFACLGPSAAAGVLQKAYKTSISLKSASSSSRIASWASSGWFIAVTCGQRIPQVDWCWRIIGMHELQKGSSEHE